ncbi:phage tail protein [Paraburkholderia sp. BR14262]|uniref:phage tail protein n=1 Tax=Paraburkholderia sp. BR14262 TaxID=3236999 RepID=UPI0034CF3A3F
MSTPYMPFEVWMKRLAESAPHASGAIFHWCPSTANAEVIPRVIETRFGDGYAQRRPAGINTQDEQGTREFVNRRKPEADAILAFLVARHGVDIFNWTPPRTTRARDVYCPEWSWTYGDLLVDGARAVSVNATFHEVHA